jgi:general nucleoside transport system ATP-binding protein
MDKQKSNTFIQLKGIVKKFPGVLANDHVDLDIKTHEILALLGENGAGKTTLMNVLAGLYKPDGGEILLNGKPVEFHSPRDAIASGIGMVHQHFMLVESLTVAENIILSLQSNALSLNLDRVRKEISALSKKYQMPIDPDAYIWQLSVGEQQRVEIMRLLYRGADVLILDEPTAVLTPNEATDLAAVLRHMANEGKAIIIITHKLNEVMDFSDRVSILRAGKKIDSVLTRETSKEELARKMVGRKVLFHLERSKCVPGKTILELNNVESLNEKGMPALKSISFQVCCGEILGVAGVAGNGQRELAEVISGLRSVTKGNIFINGEDTTNCTPLQAIDIGISHIPGDRLGVGLAPNLPISDNLTMKAYRKRPITRGFFLDREQLKVFAKNLIQTFSISPAIPETPARLLSGGNQQRLILAREITANQGVIIAVHPSRGLDVGATESVRKTLLEQREQGTSILLISEDLDEIMQISDRILILYEGKIMGMARIGDVTLDEISLMMAGQPLKKFEQEIPVGGSKT